MEKSSKKIKLSAEEVKSLDEKQCHIDDLPEEILEKVFGYLKLKDICRVGWVSTRWHRISRLPAFWRHVDAEFSLQYGSMSEAAMQFVDMLPACVSHLRLSFEPSRGWLLNFTELSTKIGRKCPNLEVLIFHRARLMAKPNSLGVMHLHPQFVASVRVLAFHHSVFKYKTILDLKDTLGSNVQVLDISRSSGINLLNSLDPREPDLKKLCLAGCDLNYIQSPFIVHSLEVLDMEGAANSCNNFPFKEIVYHGFSLVELYICFTLVSDDDLDFGGQTNVLPYLQNICLRATDVTSLGVISLIEICKSLKHICVGNLASKLERDYSECSSEKLQVKNGIEYCDHYAKIDYMCT